MPDSSPNTNTTLRGQKVDTLSTKSIDLRGRRVINAGNSVDPQDYVTRAEITELTQQLLAVQILIGKLSQSSPTQQCCAYLLAAVQAIPNAAWTPIGFDGEAFDTNSMHDLVTNNSRILIRKAGTYLILGQIWFLGAVGLAGDRWARIFMNGATQIAVTKEYAWVANVSQAINISAIYTFTNNNNYIELQAYQNSGAPINVSNGNYDTTFLQVLRLF